MVINFNVKVKGGPRTPVEVEVYWTAVNEKTITFANGNGMTATQIGVMIQKNVEDTLKSIQDEA